MTRRRGDPKTRRRGDPKTRRRGDAETRRRGGSNHPVIERVAEVARLIRKGTYNRRQLAAQFEVDPKTIQRDLEFLRDRLRHNIVYQPHTKTWRYQTLPICHLL